MLHFPPGAGWFALAGAAAAAGPVVLHLLNRRRFRVVEWGAMDFLRQALERQRRLLRLRDLWLLALRTICLACFGLALARPYWAPAGGRPAANAPAYAVIVIDNSLSMGYQLLGETLFDRAKRLAGETIQAMPPGSRFTVLPLCGTAAGPSIQAYTSRDDARDAINGLTLSDRAGSVLVAAELAREAFAARDSTLVPRWLFLSDQQANQWPAETMAEIAHQLPPIECLSVGEPWTINRWVERFECDDGFVVPGGEVELRAVVRSAGATARETVPVTLTIDDQVVASELVDLEPNSQRIVHFRYRLPASLFAPWSKVLVASAALPADRLRADDRRTLAVPIVSQLGVLLVDAAGPGAAPGSGGAGETRQLRKLLSAGLPDNFPAEAGLRSLALDQLDDETLLAARLVVLAGIPSPRPELLGPLRAFVERGGQLLIAAGAAFDPAAWNDLAWQGGAGILPAPLDPHPIGATPAEAVELRPFFLSPASMTHELFWPAGVAPDELEDLYRGPYFFKAVHALCDDEWPAQPDRWTQSDRADGTDQADPARPEVWARFDNQAPFIVARRLGLGQTVLITTGVHSSWNNLPRTHAVLLLDRLMRSMLGRTLPAVQFTQREELSIPNADRHLEYSAVRPGGRTEPLAIEALGPQQFGLTLRGLDARGFYRVSGRRAEQPRGDRPTGSLRDLGGTVVAPTEDGASGEQPDRAPPDWEFVFSLGGDARESDLTPLAPERLESLLAERSDGTGTTPLTPGAARAQLGWQLWRGLLAGVLLLLLAEMAILARPHAAAVPAILHPSDGLGRHDRGT